MIQWYSALRLSALFSAISILALGLAPQAASGASFRAAGWTGGVTYAEATGGFNGCFVTKAGSGGTRVVLFWRKDGLAVAVFDPQWDLKAETSGEIKLAVDGRWKSAATGSAVGRHAIRAELGPGEAPLKALKGGINFIVSVEGGEYSFSLKGSTKAIKFLRACYAVNS